MLAGLALATACALLSIPVVLRRWAFIGEGIGHAGFGGAGTAWMLSLAFPVFQDAGAVYAVVIAFSLVTAIGIGWLSRNSEVPPDSAIGIFLVGSFAWGVLGQYVFSANRGAYPVLLDNLLFGQFREFSPALSLATVLISVVAILVLIGLWREILYCCADPMLAESSGVHAGFIHYLMMALLGLVIVVGVRLMGTVLVTALLILPGASALLVSRRLGTVIALSVGCAWVGTVGGLMMHRWWSWMPAGPCIVLVLLVAFGVTLVLRGAVRPRTPG
jgi:ABC-type Mn2+/Zn2+ transport system permease subunit